MSEQLAHKMIRFEATPPADAWEAIAARLEDDKQHAPLATKMNHFESAPPGDAWKAIEERLEDDSRYASLAVKMNNFDAAPPPQSWKSIAAILDEPGETAIPVTGNRTRIIYRFAAAAAVIGLLIGAWMFMSNNTGADQLVKNNNIPAPAGKTPVENNQASTTNDQPARNRETVALQQTGGQEYNKPRNNLSAAEHNTHELKYAIINSIPAYENDPIIISSEPIQDKDGRVILDMDVLTTNSNYLTVMGPNGQVTRISAKFASVIRYLNGNNDNDAEEYLDKVIKESDTWKKRFQEWRNKISQSSFIPSSANFLDIIEFKELIQEKK